MSKKIAKLAIILMLTFTMAFGSAIVVSANYDTPVEELEVD